MEELRKQVLEYVEDTSNYNYYYKGILWELFNDYEYKRMEYERYKDYLPKKELGLEDLKKLADRFCDYEYIVMEMNDFITSMFLELKESEND